MTMDQLRCNIENVRMHLERASSAWDHEVELCAVTKTVSADTINMAYKCGIQTIGENRVQEVMEKLPALNHQMRLHIIGQLQTNKVKYITGCAAMIQSLDRTELAHEINKRCAQAGISMPVLVQVNIANEPQKAGIGAAELVPRLEEWAQLPGIEVCGLMAIMPFTSDPEMVRPYFRRMRGLFERVREMNIENVKMDCLSMGMSGDYAVAAEEGATMVRVGSSIFGSR